MCTTGIRDLATGCLAGLLLAMPGVQATEVVGEVQLRQTGLSREPAGQPAGGISVSLQPMDGQPLPVVHSARSHRLLVQDNEVQPAYLTIQVGDTLNFINQDEVYHELFALSPTQPIELPLDKHSAGAKARAEVRLVTEGVWHLFCRIHSRSYARIDVVATPLIRTVASGETFRFDQLAAGQWQLRVAALGAETRLLNTMAMTAPPVLRIDLSTRAGGIDARRLGQPAQGRIEALFPRD